MPTESTGQSGRPGPPRPRQATWAAVLIIAGSVLGVLFAFQRVADLGSLELRESYEELVSQPPLAGTGITADSFLEFIRIVSLVVGGAATAAAILGIYVLQRSRSARIGLSVLAPVVFLGGLVVSDLVLMVVAFGVVMLWLHPVSDWYAGRPIPEPGPRGGQPGGAARTTPPPSDPSPTPPGPTPPGPTPPGPTPPGPTPPSDPARPGASTGPQDTEPRPVAGFGQGPAPTAYRSGADPAGPDAGAPRPRQVVVACVVTWVACGLTLFVVVLSAVAVFAAPDVLLDEVLREQSELRDQSVTVGLIKTALAVVVAVIVPWCVFAVVAAALAWRRVAWARTGLLISAVAAAVLSLVLALVSLGAAYPGLLTLGLSLVTISMLLRAETRAWFATRRS